MPFDSPSTPDPHPDWHDLLAGYALGNLSPEEQVILQQILAEHPERKAELLAYEETLAMVPYGLAPKTPPAALEESIVDAVQGGHRRRQPSMAARGRRRGGSSYQAALAAAALVMALVGVDNYRLRQQRTMLTAQLDTADTERQSLENTLAAVKQQRAEENFAQVVDILRQPNALIYSLQGTEEATSSSGSLLTLPDHSEVQLVSHNLPVLPEGQVYRLWSVETDTSHPMFCGEFNNTEVGNVQWTVPDARCNANPVKVIITVDAVIDPPVPKGPAVLTGEI